MRFTISPKDAYNLPIIGFNGGEVITVDEYDALATRLEAETAGAALLRGQSQIAIDELENRVVAMEAEIDAACATACDLCRPNSEPTELIRLASPTDAKGEWYHGNERWVIPEECEASPIRERRYQRMKERNDG